MTEKRKKPLPISVEQSKLLGNTLRVKIIGVLLEKPKTAKQVATQIGETPGNVHYHIQKLHKGKLIDLVEEKRVGGVIEKYYEANASSFESNEPVYPELSPNFPASFKSSINAALQLKENDKEQLLEEVSELLKKWVIKSSSADYIDQEEFVIDFTLVSRKEKTEDIKKNNIKK
ncbi:ArsR/SmtB family transcription factor [Pseudogracilibacillus auburnensis]|uniref:Helix-turn-helix protein n=1 Tax=Pseudogracilibacillus auburnensis TaxID=1494959 RepID=A0A2V3W2D6_9BACI|nr:winged helix-turn-helix domain-containing protein [Pseudogracilibacillus auburnensis]MBO1002802.1 helix-turn-helix transcriptional regulator [Pseudogracilibacillus auburnensis]PXW87916.1 helix-turn-helix protein [Pseudogracilibacillus auburnensis]